ncbi:hypothetical protein STENM327S_02977 [Streptomyces tendae]
MTTTADPAAPLYRDATAPVADRVEDLLARMTLEDKAGLLFHDMVVPGPDGHLAGPENFLGRPATADAVQRLRMTHFNLVGPINDIRAHVRWYNRLQEAALDTPLGIPVTLSTDPRHLFLLQRRHRRPGRGPKPSAWQHCATRTWSSSTPTWCAASTWPPACAWHCTHR